tara:strand:+ start:155 stop:613 length:459 start_codon:yes stop_codon:yes gene_type:complete
VPNIGGRQSLELQINALVEKSCEGCNFHIFPYKAPSLVRNENGKYNIINFQSKKDVDKHISELIEECKKFELQGRKIDLLRDVYCQLPFFTCLNIFLNKEYQKDINKYIYCEDTGTKPYKGSYGQVPKIWIQKHFLIKKAINMLINKKKEDK